jgi:hypothetical protein
MLRIMFVFLFAGAAVASAARAQWKVSLYTGEAYHRPPAASSWKQCAAGDAVPDDSTVRTGPASSLVLEKAGRIITIVLVFVF